MQLMCTFTVPVAMLSPAADELVRQDLAQEREHLELALLQMHL
jgi:hypothetical protein